MRQRTTTPRKSTAPDFTTLLSDAVNKPGSVMEAYSAFYTYSLGNQLLALWQCYSRGIPAGPIKTFPGWKNVGRSVRKGEKGIELCLPVTFKNRSRTEAAAAGQLDTDESFRTGFVHKPNWFVLSQTEGNDIDLPTVPSWDATLALATLDITQIPFTNLNGNSQGYATRGAGREIAINPLAQLPHKTLFHECAHVLLLHTAEPAHGEDQIPRNLREVEAESVALLCCEALGLEGADFCRGYIQSWTDEPIPEQNAKRILGAADRILKAGTIGTATIH